MAISHRSDRQENMNINSKMRLDGLSKVPFKFLGAALALRTVNTLKAIGSRRFHWSVSDVGNSVCPEADFRNYYDAADVRNILHSALGANKLDRACELGCGYGRITPVLHEFANEVDGMEREVELRAIANHYSRDINILPITNLTDVAAPSARYDLIMIFTVLQHCTTPHAEATIEAMKRAIKPGGYILIAEAVATDVHSEIGDVSSEIGFLSKPRTVGYYKEKMLPAQMVTALPRRAEKSFPGHPGTLMLFRVPA
jgi:SAM-dependent methyltransferase